MDWPGYGLVGFIDLVLDFFFLLSLPIYRYASSALCSCHPRPFIAFGYRFG
jgi:hypothetical protein